MRENTEDNSEDDSSKSPAAPSGHGVGFDSSRYLQILTKDKQTTLGRKEFHDPYQFEFCHELEQNWKVIKAEFENLHETLFHPWPERNLFVKDGKEGEGKTLFYLTTGWDVFGLYAFGKKHYKNATLCPETVKLVEKIPGMSTAAFSILNPGSKILPHVGYYGYSEMVLRCHLGLSIPSVPSECYLQVGGERQSWEEGKCLVFDDTFCHAAFNHSSVPRVILLLDFRGGPLPDGQSIDTPPIDQRDYLNHITTLYGYGVKDH